MDDGHFSSAVRLSNISDFIAPSQSCILPTNEQGASVQPGSLVGVRSRGKPGEQTTGTEKKAAVKITLSDCLACVGCITSAETVLVEQQSVHALRQALGSAGIRLAVVTVSPQTIVSIAAARKISVEQAQRVAVDRLRRFGFHHVLDSSFGRLLSLEYGFSELEQRRLQLGERPILGSTCPGFVCYAEKTHPQLLVSRLTTVRSPQAVMGALVKDFLSRKSGIPAGSILHCAVMPCFDKKLEASRSEFHVPGTLDVREVDYVISSAELNAILDDEPMDADSGGVGSAEEIPSLTDEMRLASLENNTPLGGEGGSSGGYAWYAAQRIATRTDGAIVRTKEVAKYWDVIEVVADEGTATESVVFRAARVYGFRNIQNLVRRIKSGKAEYDYVEVMACPGGCGNGGGQVRPAQDTVEAREHQRRETEKLYSELILLPQETLEETKRRLIEEWQRTNPAFPGGDLLSTKFRSVDSDVLQRTQLNW